MEMDAPRAVPAGHGMLGAFRHNGFDIEMHHLTSREKDGGGQSRTGPVWGRYIDGGVGVCGGTRANRKGGERWRRWGPGSVCHCAMYAECVVCREK
jgi:hypothetical protein